MAKAIAAALAAVLAISTMGAQGCETSGGGSHTTAAHHKKHHKRHHRKHHHRKRQHRPKHHHKKPKPPPPPPPPPPPNCDPNYEGACLDPNASDYDCEGGSGDGPKYVSGPITVVGDDPFGLDRDGDGTACE